MTRAIILLCLAIVSCTPSPSSDSSSSDSLSSDPTATVSDVHSDPGYQFESQSFVSKPFAFDVTDTVAMKAIFPSYPANADGGDNEDGSPWYRLYYLDNGALTVSYYDFFDNGTQRIYYDGARTSDPGVIFSQGIKVGMSKADFVSAFKLAGEGVANAAKVTATSGEDEAVFAFDGDKLKSVTLTYSYISLPPTLSSFSGNWVSITENEGEGMVEQFQECDPIRYSLGSAAVVAGDEPIEIGLLTIGEGQDGMRTDTIEWIRRYPEGVVIRARNTGDNRPYHIRVMMKDENWMTAEWNDRLCMVAESAEQLMKFPCETEDN